MYLKLRSGCMPWPNLTKHINIILFNPLDKQKQRKGAVLRKKKGVSIEMHIKTNHTISHYIKWNIVTSDNETMLPCKPNRYKGAVLRKKRVSIEMHIKTNHTISHYIKWNIAPPDNETMLPRKPNRYITDHTVSSTWDTHLIMLQLSMAK